MALYLFEEVPESRAINAYPPSLTVRMIAAGEVDEWWVLNYTFWNTPLTYNHPSGTLWRQDIKLVPDGYARFLIEIPYAPIKKEQGKFSFTFDTSGASINIKCSRQHVADYALTGTNNTNPYGGAINATPEGVEGCDIIIPALKLTCTFTHPEGVVSIGYVKTLARATGCTNADSFLGFDPGELLFGGASGSDGTDTDATLSYTLIASENVTGMSIGAISGIAKDGHDYLWVEFEPKESNNQAARKPKRVHVERVYNSVNFANTFGWS